MREAALNPPNGSASFLPSAPGTLSTSSLSNSADENGINVEALRYVVSFRDNSTHKSPRSANPPPYLAHAERWHLPSHRTAWRATRPYPALPPGQQPAGKRRLRIAPPDTRPSQGTPHNDVDHLQI